jgi:putative transposase
MARGIERREIFRDDRDRMSFLKRLARIFEETETQCYAWTLIPNHFHLLLRTGTVPLSKIMRRLMTGHAVRFNKRYKRSGHLFQNRYKSVVCEQNSYLLELIRYIHLNPIRARQVKDLEELDHYPWCGHGVLMGTCKNPLIPEMEESSQPDRSANPFLSLAEKTVDEVLRRFGESIDEARSHYRGFVEKGIKQGRRPELQGGGLIRSMVGKTAALSEIRRGQTEKSDQRVLGSGEFVSVTLQQSERILEKKYLPKRSIEELIEFVAGKLSLKAELICSGSRQKQYSEARSMVSWLAVEETGHSASEVARYLGIGRENVLRSVKRGREIGKRCAERTG